MRIKDAPDLITIDDGNIPVHVACYTMYTRVKMYLVKYCIV